MWCNQFKLLVFGNIRGVFRRFAFTVFKLMDCRQITFVTLNGFCLLSKKTHPRVLNRQNQDWWSTNQNQIKNIYPFYIVFEVLKVLLTIICKMQPLHLLFLVRFHISRYHFSLFLELHTTCERKIFVTNFPFLTDSLNLPPTPLMAKSAKHDKSFLSMLPNIFFLKLKSILTKINSSCVK